MLLSIEMFSLVMQRCEQLVTDSTIKLFTIIVLNAEEKILLVYQTLINKAYEKLEISYHNIGEITFKKSPSNSIPLILKLAVTVNTTCMLIT